MDQLTMMDETIPSYSQTKAIALKLLRDAGKDLKQKNRIYWAYMALGSATREECYEFLANECIENNGPYIKMASVLGRTHELIWEDKKLRCIGQKYGPDGSPVEIIGPGEDKRLRVPHAKLATVKPMIIKVPAWPWVILGLLIGYMIGRMV